MWDLFLSFYCICLGFLLLSTEVIKVCVGGVILCELEIRKAGRFPSKCIEEEASGRCKDIVSLKEDN